LPLKDKGLNAGCVALVSLYYSGKKSNSLYGTASILTGIII
jgi:hypothetical protein